jgi:hypothetical protein
VFGSVDGDGVVFGAVFANAAQARLGGIVVESDLAIEGSYGVSGGKCAVTAGPGVPSRSLSLVMQMTMERSTAEMPATSSGCPLGEGLRCRVMPIATGMAW